ncbi:hypothetical protein BK809_0006011 [Diplodia seriata]|uniref:Protein kinase domain-containing protein n=1 Tax=Diplodia seriata TaxID=420778 RepID=A0A1S8BPB4_9PEZI|nr:hypothetical protein BK809_0006011 [Diplodia seriata]
MDKGNSKIVETLEQSVLLSHEYSVPSMIEQAIEESSSERLGIKDHLKLRKIVLAKSTDYGEQRTREEPSEVPRERVWEERKEYGENQTDADIEDIKERVALLAKVLECGKPEDFRALRLIRWEHRVFEYQFIYHFEIPRIYEGEPQSLFDAIKKPLSRTRPSLDQRFDMARCVAKAVQHWHSVGWVHQGICSHHILFFIRKNQEMDFSLPYLQGFDFSRPNLKPSLGRYVDDIRFDIYRHPDRQGPSRDGHRKSHDLYSLGVVLLEIGLWRRAIDIIADATRKKKFTKEDVRNIFMGAAKTRLAHYAGTNYQRAVCACLES